MDIQLQDSENQCSLKWKKHEDNLLNVFEQLLHQEALVDVTLATEGKSLKCHKVVLSACSSYFKSILSGTDQTQHPIVILRDISWSELNIIVQYMYKGEMNISQEELPSILKIAESLKLYGLVDFESKGSASGISLKKNLKSISYDNNEKPNDESRQKRKRPLIQCDENSCHSDPESMDFHKTKHLNRTTMYSASHSPSSSSSHSESKDNLDKERKCSVSQSSTPQPPALANRPPPPPPSNSPMTVSSESRTTPPKLKGHGPNSIPHTSGLPLSPSMANSSTSGMNDNSTNNFLPNLMHFSSQHHKMFPNLSSPNHNNQGFLGPSGSKKSHYEDMSDVKPSILEMIQEERRVCIYFLSFQNLNIFLIKYHMPKWKI